MEVYKDLNKPILILKDKVNYHKLLKLGFTPIMGDESVLVKHCDKIYELGTYLKIDFETKEVIVVNCKDDKPYFVHLLTPLTYKFHNMKKYLPKRFLKVI